MYKVTDGTKLSSIFDHLSHLKERGVILDFKVNRSSLESVFEQFAKH